MMGPDYVPPEITLNDSWNADEHAKTAVPLERWWEQLNDPLLNSYICKAAECNYDVRVAESNILRARALRQVAASKLFPQVGADLNGTKTYFSKNGPVFAIGQATGNTADTSSPLTGLPFAVQVPQIQNLFNALFDASWELDLFGKTRRSVEAAQAEYESAIDHKNDVLISAFAEVARNYIDLRSVQKRAELLQKSISLVEQNRDIVMAGLDVGYFNQIDLEAIETELANARALLPDAYSEIYRTIYTLSILIGQLPETLVDELFVPQPLPKAPERIAVGLRSDLLRRRPDVRYAERKLAEATAGIGVAVASFFPTVSLLANGGFQSLALPQLFEWGSKTWAYGADVNMPIFQGGRLVGNLNISRAEAAMTAASYQQTVLSALQEAESNLKKYEEQTAAVSQHNKAVLHNTYVVALSRERYLKGLTNLIDLLNNEKQLIAAELAQLDSQSAELFDLISLYKSLGGGWQADACQHSD